MPSHSASPSQLERQSLADALIAAGPDAPTLCEGWTARDLVAHLVVREGRPDAALGLVVPGLGGWGEGVRRKVARRQFEDLVETFRSGPPMLSWARVPKVDETLNFAENFVHNEDVRRGTPGWTPRVLPDGVERLLFRSAVGAGRMFFRKARCGVTLAWPAAGRQEQVKKGLPLLVLSGAPAELLLYTYGRGSAADVTIEGPNDAVAEFKALKLGL